jgi:Tol biopolymer transport system component
MPDLGTQLRDHYDSVITLIDAEDIIEGRIVRASQQPPARSPLRGKRGVIVALTAAATVLIVVGGIALALRLIGDGTVEPAGPVPTKITFSAYGSDDEGWSDIFVMNPDGTGIVNLTNNEAWDKAPAWSPDGSRIVFVREVSTDPESSPVETIFLMDADGANVMHLTEGANPSWSPQGNRILFERDTGPCKSPCMRSGGTGTSRIDIFVINVDGTGETNLTNAPSWDSTPAWSPDESRIVFASNRHESPDSCDDETRLEDCNLEIWAMNLDGSNPVRLTYEPGIDAFPDWSPDGTRIVFHTARDGNLPTGEGFEVYVMNADGTNQTNLTNHPSLDALPNWSPDGTRIVFISTRHDPDQVDRDIYVIDPDGTNLTRLTTSQNGRDSMWPNW